MTFGCAKFKPGDNLEDVMASADAELYGEKKEESASIQELYVI